MAAVVQRPAPVDLWLYRSDTTVLNLKVTDKATGDPINLTGTVAASVRLTPDAATVLEDFTVTNLNPAAGTVTLGLDTTTLPAHSWWDLQWTNAAGERLTLVGGKVDVTGDITRP